MSWLKQIRLHKDVWFLVLAVEATHVRQHCVRLTDEGLESRKLARSTWDCRSFLSDPTGLRLVEELARRTHQTLETLDEEVRAVAVTLPGTLDHFTTVLRSTRLGIYEALDWSEHFGRAGVPPTFLFHDAECMALGEAHYGVLAHEEAAALRDNFAYVLVDEGVGCTLIINGAVQHGAGSAGQLGRLVVEPDGEYNRTFSSRGPLEVFAARPWVSSRIVGEFLAEQGKQGAVANDSAFRTAVAAAAAGDWTSLTADQIGEGARLRDPIVLTVLEDGARYLGLAVNALITIVNPPAIVLGGAMIEALPEFTKSVISYARRYSWRLAWNRTAIHVAALGRQAQTYGAAMMLHHMATTAETTKELRAE